jgi:sec-independent protein translocase protein TatA
MFGGIGTTELLVIALVLLILFGGKKLNELARGLGKSAREIKKLKKEYSDALLSDFEEDVSDGHKNNIKTDN